MKVSGFTFIRNAIKYDYPIVEAITSILPLCDEFIVCVGKSEDETEELIRSIPSSKIKIIHSVWDEQLRKNGEVLAVETNKAFDAISEDSDWAFYIQGDEVIHEKYLPEIKAAMEANIDKKNVECLVLKYLHFYGSYNYVGDTRKWYRREIRIIRNDKKIRSYKDAQGFRRNEKRLHGKLVNAYVFHYGWVKNPYQQQEKAKTFNKLWHSDQTVEKMVSHATEYDYSLINSLSLFNDTHPAVMHKRISAMNWDFEFDPTKKQMKFKERILNFIEQKTGKRLFEFRNYEL